ncbi:MAG TPA: GyrI-like domain-containing protein [Saprospiraceae bacterium]|nr:GyrI-like domain-containing protein [Saprospiraceae bacterium]HMP23761.1 GyrI-like domain-containing protein [Saprospiraceae bacterium]
MKALKTIGVVLAMLIVLVLVLGLIAPRTVATEKSIVINAPRATVFPYLQYHAQQQTWSPWNELDPNMTSEIVGTDGTVGSIYKWAGNKDVGVGEQEITAIVPDERVETHLRFKGQGEAEAFMALADAAGGTEMTWGFSTTTPYPMNVMNLFLDIAGMVGKDYEKGLNKLKTMIETNKKYRGHAIQVMDAPTKYFLALRETVTISEISARYQQNLPKVFAAAQQAGLEMTGMPCGLFFVWDEANGKTDMAHAVPIATKASVPGFDIVEIPAGRLLVIDYYGSYDGTAEAHYAMDEYLREHGQEAGEPVWEEYVTDPTTEPDTSKWLTRVYYPLKQ